MLIRFLSGLEKEIAVTCHTLDLPKNPGLGGGLELWKCKTQLLIDACQNEGEKESSYGIFSDIDITVYRPFREKLNDLMEGHDILFQREWLWKENHANIGFIVFRRSPSVRIFWETVLRRVEEENLWDQEVVNLLLADKDFLKKHNIRIGFLPEEFWCFSMGTLPKSPCVLHHANCATSMAKKWLQMTLYQPLFAPPSFRWKEAFTMIAARLGDRVWSCGELGQSTLAGQFHIIGNKTVKKCHGRIDFQSITITQDRLVFHQEGEKLKTVLEEFYIDFHRNRMLCVGRLYPKDFFSARQKNGFFFMYASLEPDHKAIKSRPGDIIHGH